MGKADRLVMQVLGVAGKKDEEVKVVFMKNSALFQGIFKTWYFDTWYEKLIYVLGFVALFYSIGRIVFQGFW